MPALSGPFTPPVPDDVTLRIQGLTRGAIAHGHAVTAKGKALPTELAGQKVHLRLQRWQYGTAHTIKIWVRVRSATLAVGSAGAFSWRFTPKARGQYRVRTFMDATSAYGGVTTAWRHFRVK